MGATQTLAILNAIRDTASTEYQTLIPTATKDNFKTIGFALTEYVTLLNEFTNALIGKIGLTIFADKMAKNRLARFKSGTLDAASDVEEIFVEMGKGVKYDPEGPNPLGRRKPDNVHVLYHRENWKETFEGTISDEQVKNAFRSIEGIQNLMMSQITALYSGANHAEFLAMKNLLATYGVMDQATGNMTSYYYTDYEVSPITTEATAKQFVKTVRKAAADMSFMSNQFNAAAVQTYCEKPQQVLLINKDVTAEVDVEVLAKSFNMGKTDFEPTIIELDNFGSMANTYGILLDEDFFRVFGTLFTMESIRNPQGLFTNYFLHVWQVLSVSKFKNAIRFIKKV
jgi:hypothetical protein